MNLYELKAVYQDLQNRIEAGEDLDDFSDVMIDMPTWKKLLKLWGN